MPRKKVETKTDEINKQTKKSGTIQKKKPESQKKVVNKIKKKEEEIKPIKKEEIIKRPKKKVEKKKKKNEGLVSVYKNVGVFISKYKIFVITAFSLLMIIFITSIIMPNIILNTKVITIDGNDYTKSDFMIYLYSVKYNYFGKDNTNVPEATLNTQVNNTDKMTIREYLKEKTTNEIKIAAAIQKIALENNIELSKKNIQELEKEKTKFIENLGGDHEFKKLLKNNKTTEESYDKMAHTDKLYKVILHSLYSDNKKYDLTEEEKINAKNEYYSSYYKISQIILATIDLNTKKDLNETTINQKSALSNTILNEIKAGVNFNELIEKYSENVDNKEAPYSTYYKKGDLLEELEKVVSKLNDGDISDVIKTNYAFHIIKKEQLDDGKLNNVYNEKREEKLLKRVSENLEKISVIYQNKYENIKIK